ncbi:DUF6328 family protein [Mycobacterium sp. pW049]|uniref:DUF6328 family protein n=1 Tax=[Mycobacterium] bulgaricum TaxID=3238985 RepID=UPI00351B2F33
MGAEHPQTGGRPYDDENWDRAQRGETQTERLDRNWASLLQELRVVQTGVQLLTGFLLTLPFQQRFDILDNHMQAVYLATVCAAVASTALLIAPVAMHRILFRRHRLAALVRAAHRCAYAGLLLLAIAVTGMTVIIFDAVVGLYPALIAGGCALVVFATFWLAWPFSMRSGGEQPPAP